MIAMIERDTPPIEQMLDIKAVADALAVSETTVRRMTRHKEWSARLGATLILGQWRFPPERIRRIVAARNN